MSPPVSQPFARSSRARGTTAGIIAWLAERNTISPVLMTNSTAYSSAMLPCPVAIAVARTAIAATRVQSITTIRRRRSTRSTRTPPGRANSSHGSQDTPVAPDTINGLDVREATYSGAAMSASPLPRADVVLAAQSLTNRAPRRSAASLAPSPFSAMLTEASKGDGPGPGGFGATSRADDGQRLPSVAETTRSVSSGRQSRYSG